jgi:hypothetical protein
MHVFSSGLSKPTVLRYVLPGRSRLVEWLPPNRTLGVPYLMVCTVGCHDLYVYTILLYYPIRLTSHAFPCDTCLERKKKEKKNNNNNITIK